MRIRIRTYVVTLKHDAGLMDIALGARNKGVAKDMIMAAEHCPARAIKKIRWAK
jgi:ferredoxin